MNLIINILVVSILILTFNSCSSKDLQMFNKALHDSQVQENRKTQQRVQKCRQDYANGYRSDLNCY